MCIYCIYHVSMCWWVRNASMLHVCSYNSFRYDYLMTHSYMIFLWLIYIWYPSDSFIYFLWLIHMPHDSFMRQYVSYTSRLSYLCFVPIMYNMCIYCVNHVPMCWWVRNASVLHVCSYDSFIYYYFMTHWYIIPLWLIHTWLPYDSFTCYYPMTHTYIIFIYYSHMTHSYIITLWIIHVSYPHNSFIYDTPLTHSYAPWLIHAPVRFVHIKTELLAFRTYSV